MFLARSRPPVPRIFAIVRHVLLAPSPHQSRVTGGFVQVFEILKFFIYIWSLFLTQKYIFFYVIRGGFFGMISGWFRKVFFVLDMVVNRLYLGKMR